MLKIKMNQLTDIQFLFIFLNASFLVSLGLSVLYGLWFQNMTKEAIDKHNKLVDSYPELKDKGFKL